MYFLIILDMKDDERFSLHLCLALFSYVSRTDSIVIIPENLFFSAKASQLSLSLV
jgi:hypothetical protein